MTETTVADLWRESEGEPDRFRALMAEHGFLVRTHEEDFWLSLQPPGSRRYSFARDELATALTRLDVSVLTDGPCAGMINADAMAGAIIEALGEASTEGEMGA